MSGRDEHGRFVKGVSGNPGGRPKGPSPTNALVDLLLESPTIASIKFRPEDAPLVAIAKALVIQAASPTRDGLAAARTIMERLDGPPIQRIALDTPQSPIAYLLADVEDERLQAIRAALSEGPDRITVADNADD